MSLARTSSSASRAPLTPSTPATPAAQADQAYTPSGKWKHPKFDEIARRQYATTFDERNVRAIVANAALLFLSLYGNTVASTVKVLEYAATPINAVVKAVPGSEWAIMLVRLAFVANVAIAFLPLVRRYYPDDIADIPLTPSQRASMGLRAGVLSPQTPGSAYASPNYVTPPRYQRSTPRSGSFSNHDRGSQSPLSGTSSPRGGFAMSTSNSPFSPNASGGSPLFQKALNGSTTKRLSYGGSPMGSSLFGDSSSSATPGTPTPSTGKASDPYSPACSDSHSHPPHPHNPGTLLCRSLRPPAPACVARQPVIGT
ncbi:nuclear pore complex component-domain-containing protein [Phaeosphaeria sp. MPI-PUGE-AT-0046c]|nr:nuclear pore complex component-domain-containing protein [Phaeosphaeria sp. MPI-PUGE-AT-0046c]